jgi:hypothetical protein
MCANPQGLLAGAVALLAASAALPAAGATIDAVRIAIVHVQVDGVDQGWQFEVEVAGSGLDAGLAPSLTIPGPVSLPFSAVSATSLRFVQGEFASMEAVLQSFTTGSYRVSADDAEVAVVLATPTPPVSGVDSATLEVVFPEADESTTEIPNRSPTFVVEYECSNCDFMEAALSSGGALEAEPLKATAPDPFPCSYPLATFGLGPLASSERTIAVTAGTESVQDVVGVAYTQQTARRDAVNFTVADGGALPAVEDLTLAYQRSYEAGELSFLNWNFSAALAGGEIATATVFPPCGSGLELFDEGLGELEGLEGGYSSLQSLQQDFPPTNDATQYVLVIDDGLLTASVDFDPQLNYGGPPDGNVIIAAPEFGETVDGSRISFQLDNACTNCTSTLLEVLDLDPEPPFLEGSKVDVAYFDDTLPLPATIFASYPSDFGDNESGPNYRNLPEGDYKADVDVAVAGVELDLDLIPSGTFDLETGFFMTDVIEFTAPEPGGALLQLAAISVVSAWSRRRRG